MTMTEFNEMLGVAKKVATVLIGLSLPATLYAKGDQIFYAVGNLGAQLKSAEIAGVKLEFSEAAIRKYVRPDLFSHLDPAERRAIANDMAAFDARAVVRLLSLSFLDKPCEYERPTHEMAQEYAADIFLRERELAVIEFDDAERDRIAQKLKASGEKSDIGYPRACYKVTLTKRGMNVRTAMMHVFAANLATSLGEKDAPAAKPYQEASN
ncbi:hypothetical protein [Methylocystis sp. ATCC 49242]|uniref:hypothetical protein n=1 Tax=Methylocystis sp. ATCC 49242 TaxID=622637 RepID=UPI0001F87E6D|nr:hypothetical protein [Methylocystis sp. ATCC 49242]